MADSKSKQDDLQKKYQLAIRYRQRYAHSNRSLYKAILEALPNLNDGDDIDQGAVDLTIKAGKVMDLLGEASRTWNISIHWLFTVCNPKIKDQSNSKYSPVYEQHATKLPLNRFGELERLVDDGTGNLIKFGDKVVGDDRYVGQGSEEFGTSWNDSGTVVKRDSDDHPVLDGFVYGISRLIDNIQTLCCRNPNRDRNFRAFMIAHTRDDEENKRNGDVEHKESHVHMVIDMPTRRTRYRMMKLLGFHFEDLTETFKWISQQSTQRSERIDAFLGTLQGVMQNYVVTKHYISSLQYLIHQSGKAKQAQKTPYAINEVFSWLPDDPGESYSSIAGVYDDEMVASGVNAAIIRNLHSPYNLVHHTARLVGRNDGDRVFSYHQLSKLRRLGTKGTGHMTFSRQSKKLILDQLMEWIYSGRMEVTDWKNAIHGAFDDGDAASLIADQDFIKKLTAILDDQRESTINDINADRDMTTIFISAAQGGIGKSYLASRLCQYWEKGRTPYMTAAEDKGKTVDYWQDYEDQASAVIDEISASSIEWGALKDMLDPHKIPRVSSRFHNTSPWNLNLLILTNVYSDGIAGYIRDVLHYAPGITQLGYLEQDDGYGKSWSLKTDDSDAGEIYLSQLSQLLRRLPVNVHMVPTDNNRGTEVIVSIINFRPGGRAIRNYDYVYTRESDHIFNLVINEDLPEKDFQKVIVTVAKMIRDLKQKAKVVFKQDPNATLGKSNGFLERHANFGVYFKNGKPYLSENNNATNDNVDGLFDNSYTTSDPTVNMLTKLSHLKYELWPEVKVADTNFSPEGNQFTALMRGKTVPLRRAYDDQWITLTLTPKAMDMLKHGQATSIVLQLNSTTSITESNELFRISKSDKVARILSS